MNSILFYLALDYFLRYSQAKFVKISEQGYGEHTGTSFAPLWAEFIKTLLLVNSDFRVDTPFSTIVQQV